MSLLQTALRGEIHRVNFTGIPKDARLDKEVERREQVEAYKSGRKPYSFVRLLGEISCGELSMEEFDTMLGLAAGYEGISPQQICTQLREVLHQEPKRTVYLTAEMSVKISLIADS